MTEIEKVKVNVFIRNFHICTTDSSLEVDIGVQIDSLAIDINGILVNKNGNYYDMQLPKLTHSQDSKISAIRFYEPSIWWSIKSEIQKELEGISWLQNFLLNGHQCT